MATSSPKSLSRLSIHVLVIAAGLAALSWEVIWQIKSSLALGVSAWGTALTLAATMGGMSIGSLGMGHILRNKKLERPVRLYGVLEIIIGVSGLLIGAAFRAVEQVDTFTYNALPGSASFVHLLSIAAVLGVPTICMGATLPVLGLVSRQFRTSISTLYALNTLGAAAGTLVAALFLIPAFGIAHTAWIIAAVDIAVGVSTWLLGPGETEAAIPATQTKTAPDVTPAIAPWIVLTTGFATFALEIAWFRSFTAAFRSTTDAFAIMLASVLIALGIAARLVPVFRQKKISLGSLICGAGLLILVATPLIERFDLVAPYINLPEQTLLLDWFFMTFLVIGGPIMLLGVALPWVLDSQKTSRSWGAFYALNTCAAVAGSLGAAWLLLPSIGFARTSWLVGALVTIVGIFAAPRRKKSGWAVFGLAALLLAMANESGVGRMRTQGHVVYDPSITPEKILEFYEGPEATVSAIEYSNGGRALIVDGFMAAGQLADTDAVAHYHYMPWMGHLPMLASPDPKNALVICFGTGQTSNAVRMENPQSLDIVDINPRVFRLAHNFAANQDVLDDPRVKATVMDGRAYMRRTNKTYDVITLEPMPPNFAGVNALYSKEFYDLARQRLGPDGMIAQWMPLLHVTPESNISIAKTFQSVFPNSILWLDPIAKTAILLGTVNDHIPLGKEWPGFGRAGGSRDLSKNQVRDAVVLNPNQLRHYAEGGTIITDDNQLLAYGKAVFMSRLTEHLGEENIKLMDEARQGAAN